MAAPEVVEKIDITKEQTVSAPTLSFIPNQEKISQIQALDEKNEFEDKGYTVKESDDGFTAVKTKTIKDIARDQKVSPRVAAAFKKGKNIDIKRFYDREYVSKGYTVEVVGNRILAYKNITRVAEEVTVKNTSSGKIIEKTLFNSSGRRTGREIDVFQGDTLVREKNYRYDGNDKDSVTTFNYISGEKTVVDYDDGKLDEEEIFNLNTGKKIYEKDFEKGRIRTFDPITGRRISERDRVTAKERAEAKKPKSTEELRKERGERTEELQKAGLTRTEAAQIALAEQKGQTITNIQEKTARKVVSKTLSGELKTDAFKSKELVEALPDEVALRTKGTNEKFNVKQEANKDVLVGIVEGSLSNIKEDKQVLELIKPPKIEESKEATRLASVAKTQANIQKSQQLTAEKKAAEAQKKVEASIAKGEQVKSEDLFESMAGGTGQINVLANEDYIKRVVTAEKSAIKKKEESEKIASLTLSPKDFEGKKAGDKFGLGVVEENKETALTGVGRALDKTFGGTVRGGAKAFQYVGETVKGQERESALLDVAGAILLRNDQTQVGAFTTTKESQISKELIKSAEKKIAITEQRERKYLDAETLQFATVVGGAGLFAGMAGTTAGVVAEKGLLGLSALGTGYKGAEGISAAIEGDSVKAGESLTQAAIFATPMIIKGIKDVKQFKQGASGSKGKLIESKDGELIRVKKVDDGVFDVKPSKFELVDKPIRVTGKATVKGVKFAAKKSIIPDKTAALKGGKGKISKPELRRQAAGLPKKQMNLRLTSKKETIKFGGQRGKQDTIRLTKEGGLEFEQRRGQIKESITFLKGGKQIVKLPQEVSTANQLKGGIGKKPASQVRTPKKLKLELVGDSKNIKSSDLLLKQQGKYIRVSKQVNLKQMKVPKLTQQQKVVRTLQTPEDKVISSKDYKQILRSKEATKLNLKPGRQVTGREKVKAKLMERAKAKTRQFTMPKTQDKGLVISERRYTPTVPQSQKGVYDVPVMTKTPLTPNLFKLGGAIAKPGIAASFGKSVLLSETVRPSVSGFERTLSLGTSKVKTISNPSLKINPSISFGSLASVTRVDSKDDLMFKTGIDSKKESDSLMDSEVALDAITIPALDPVAETIPSTPSPKVPGTPTLKDPVFNPKIPPPKSPPSKIPPPKSPPFKIKNPDPIIEEQPPLFPQLKLPKLPKSKKGKYDVKVKEKGKFKTLNKKPHTKEAAFDYGNYLVENSAARSFKVTKSKKKGKSVDTDYPGTFNKANYKKKGKVYIEPSKRAINTIGELQGITAKGLAAQKRKQFFKF